MKHFCARPLDSQALDYSSVLTVIKFSALKWDADTYDHWIRKIKNAMSLNTIHHTTEHFSHDRPHYPSAIHTHIFKGINFSNKVREFILVCARYDNHSCIRLLGHTSCQDVIVILPSSNSFLKYSWKPSLKFNMNGAEHHRFKKPLSNKVTVKIS